MGVPARPIIEGDMVALRWVAAQGSVPVTVPDDGYQEATVPLALWEAYLAAQAALDTAELAIATYGP